MSIRPTCIVASAAAPFFAYRPDDAGGGVDCRIRPLSDVGGLTQMGVKLRELSPGCRGSHLHFHDVEEEWAYVLSGSGSLRLGSETVAVRPGHFIAFPPVAVPHCFTAGADESLLLLEGGERRPEEDWRTYPELGLRSRNGRDEAIDVALLESLDVDLGQILHVDDTPEQAMPHPLDQEAIRHVRRIGASTALRRQACAWVRLDPDTASTVFHRHDRTDEWVYVLSGDADARIGEDWHRIGPGDFIAYPAGGPPHVTIAHTEFVYLMGGQSLPGDIVRYPEHGRILGPNGFEAV